MLHEILIHDITVNDDYRVSRPYTDRLMRSIKQNGILNPPVLIKKDGTFMVLSGHNRIALAKISLFDRVRAHVLDSFDVNVFCEEVLRKDYHELLGPAGKLKSLKILNDNGVDASTIESVGSKLSINEYYRSNILRIDEFFQLPQSLIVVLDSKSVPHKTIRLLHDMDSRMVENIAALLNTVVFKMNYIKEMVELVYDLSRMSPSGEFMNKAVELSKRDKIRDEDIIGYLYAMRHPEYVKLKDASEQMKKTFSQNGIELEFPPFFEGNDAAVKMKISKRDNGASFMKGKSYLDKIDIEEVLKYL